MTRPTAKPVRHDTSDDSTPLCEKVGNLIVCLHYLSTQARNDGLSQIAAEIDRTIASTAHAGRDIYMDYLQSVVARKALGPADFVEDFCNVTDETVKGALMQIVRETGRHVPEL